jgi:prepilin-type N-terminal cleavage/methylation domain-containing protein
MNIKTRIYTKPSGEKQRAMTLVELMVAMGVGSIMLAVVAVLVVFAARSFAALGNYQMLDQASSEAADRISKEMREATAVGPFNPVGDIRWIVITNGNASPPYTLRYEWSRANHTLTAQRSDQADPMFTLRACDQWNFTFQQRTPLPGPTFGFSTNMVDRAECKIVTMNWKCSRPLSSTKLLNTESVQTAQIVLRNQKTP